MSEKDFVGEPLTVGFSGTFDMNGLYLLLHEWFIRHDYKIDEKEYREYKDEGKRKLALVWKVKKKVDDYVKFEIDVRLSLTDMQHVTLKKKKAVQAQMTLMLIPYLLKDYEDVWARKGWMKFMREAYDRLIIRSRMDAFEKDLVEEMRRLTGEVKAYLNLTKVAVPG